MSSENIHYVNRYNKFIDSLRNQVVEGYTEKHHIIPRSHGGTHDDSNLIRLTPRQHYVAHWMLWKAYGKEMTTAFHYMSGIKRYGKRLNSKTFSIMKLEEIERQKNKIVSEETRKKMSVSAKNKPPISDETRKKLSLKTKERGPRSEETRKKISQNSLGKKMPAIAAQNRLKTYYANHTPHKWVNKDGIRMKVKVEDVNKYLQIGYLLGTGHVATQEYRDKLSAGTKKAWQKIKQNNDIRGT
jgi:hypothetical protein